MSSEKASENVESSVSRVAVENHPLAAGSMTTSTGSQPQIHSPPRSSYAAPTQSQTPAQAQPNSAAAITTSTTTPQPNRSVGVGGNDSTKVSPSSKSLDELADEFLSAKPPPISLRPDPLPRGEVGIVRLRTLVDRRAWGDVLKLASALLDGSSKKSSKNKQYPKVYSSTFSSGEDGVDGEIDSISENVRQETIEILMLRCNALLKLRRYKDLSIEIEQWKFLKQNDVTAQPVEWLPWGIYILAGQSLEYSGDTGQAADVLCHLREDISSEDYRWLASLDNALANIYIRSGKWRLALGCLDSVRDLVPLVAEAEIRSIIGVNAKNEGPIVSFFAKSYTCEILSRQGRIFLQIGALSAAREVFDAAKTLWAEIESPSSLSTPLPEEISIRQTNLRVVTEALLDINEGLLHFSDSNYEEALQSFSNAIDIFRKDGVTFQSQYRTQDWVGPAIAGYQNPSLLYSEAVNNASLCNLYMCNMMDAVVSLESLVREDPTAFLTERVAFNLCTLYELGSDSSVALRKKQVLQLIAKRFFLHDIGPESFRVV